jgi:hypothetical protein
MWSRTLIAVLTLLLTIPYFLVDKWFVAENKRIKKEVKQLIISGLPQEELTTLSFSKSEIDSLLTWKHSREFVYHGQYYDIVSHSETTDSVTYICWWDKAETELNRRLNGLTAAKWSQSNPHHSTGKTLGVLLKRIGIPIESFSVYYVANDCYPKPILWDVAFPLLSVERNIDSPPPECCF